MEIHHFLGLDGAVPSPCLHSVRTGCQKRSRGCRGRSCAPVLGMSVSGRRGARCWSLCRMSNSGVEHTSSRLCGRRRLGKHWIGQGRCRCGGCGDHVRCWIGNSGRHRLCHAYRGGRNQWDRRAMVSCSLGARVDRGRCWSFLGTHLYTIRARRRL